MNPYFAEQLAAQAARQRDLHLASAAVAEQATTARHHRLADLRSRIQVHVARRRADARYTGPVPARSAC